MAQGGYDTILQGSYRNDTALATMNDVDIVSIVPEITLKNLGLFRSPNWEVIFADIERRLSADRRYEGKLLRRDKCIELQTGIHVDVVPAVSVKSAGEDPLAIYSWSSGKKINWPRTHYANSVAKNDRTAGGYKTAVRLFKRWARCRFEDRKLVPSYYLECLLHSMPDGLFSADLAETFVTVGSAISRQYSGALAYHVKPLTRVDGGGEILCSDEWSGSAFKSFVAELAAAVAHAAAARAASSVRAAKAAWRVAFGGHEP